MYSRSAELYDAIYAFKDYRAEAEKLHVLIQEHKPGAKTLLDVACGTGKHLGFLREHYQVEGLDLNLELLNIAKAHYPDIPFHHGDMLDFSLKRRFDVVTCLFSAIGYVKTLENLQRAMTTMARHLEPGGLLVVEPWFAPEAYAPGTVHARFVDEPELKTARMNVSERKDNLSVMTMHYLVGTPKGVDYFSEVHELGLFTHEEYLEAFAKAGLEVHHDPQGLMGRGLYLGLAP